MRGTWAHTSPPGGSTYHTTQLVRALSNITQNGGFPAIKTKFIHTVFYVTPLVTVSGVVLHIIQSYPRSKNYPLGTESFATTHQIETYPEITNVYLITSHGIETYQGLTNKYTYTNCTVQATLLWGMIYCLYLL